MKGRNQQTTENKQPNSNREVRSTIDRYLNPWSSKNNWSFVKRLFVHICGLIIFAYLFFRFVMFLAPASAEANTEDYIGRMDMHYKGVIIDKYKNVKGYPFLIIWSSDGQKLEFSDPADELFEEARVGDSIIKVPKCNCCYLKSKEREIQMDYIYIPDSISKRPDWPKEYRY